MHAGFGDWENATRKEIRREGSVESTRNGSKGKGALLRIFCCRARDETRGLHLGEWREKRKSVGSLPGLTGSLGLLAGAT